ncbi:transcriptional repressor CodY [Bacillus sp. NRRL B-14911]|nr:transcriptional repressor CodY [Bacillus sp. NRRL B-14911]
MKLKLNLIIHKSYFDVSFFGTNKILFYAESFFASCFLSLQNAGLLIKFKLRIN